MLGKDSGNVKNGYVNPNSDTVNLRFLLIRVPVACLGFKANYTRHFYDIKAPTPKAIKAK